jgi:predicted nucleic acid-binding protein
LQPNLILVDSGPLIALFDKDDDLHVKIIDFFSSHDYQFVTTVAVLTEVFHMLEYNKRQQEKFLEWLIEEGTFIWNISQDDLPQILVLTKRYSDLPMDFADATLVITAQKSNIREIVSIDSDFDIYRLPGKERIHNVFDRWA